MLRARLTATVLLLLAIALLVTVGATVGAVQDWRQDLVRDGLDAATAERQLLRRIAAVAGGTAAAALLLAGVSAWLLIGRQLRGVTGLVPVARRFGAGERGTRMTGRPGTEAGALAVAFNAMADDLEAELERRQRAEDDLRRFLEDASHELRTPVATVRGYAELFRRGGTAEPGALATAMARIESESARIGALVEGMLALASSDRPGERPAVPVPLRALAARAIDDARVRDPERRWFLADGTDTVALGDPVDLRRALDNLLANVTAHCAPGTTATVRVTDATSESSGASGASDTIAMSEAIGAVGANNTIATSEAIIEVSDDGPGLSHAVGADPFGRFVRERGDPAGAPAGGAGLGLAIVRAVATAHGGRAELVSPGSDGGLTVRIVVPRPKGSSARPSAGRPAVPPARGA